MESLINILLVFAGGGLGAVCRFVLSQYRIFDSAPYWGTTAVNISGCFIIGLLWTILHSIQLPRSCHILCITGFLGGYTTYSAFTNDAIILIQSGMLWRGLMYIFITLVGGISGYGAGVLAARQFIHNN